MHSAKVSLTLLLMWFPLFAQANLHQQLHDALVLEQQGRFEAAAKLAKSVIASNRLEPVELGRAYIILGVACYQNSDLSGAREAFEQALHIFHNDAEHQSDYAAALKNYGQLYGDSGQFEIARSLWLKALHLREELGDRAGVMRTLADLAQLSLAQGRVRQAKQYFRKTSEALEKAANDLTADDFVVFLETEGFLALAEKHGSAAVSAFQRALDECQQTRGRDHWLTGWEHILLGKAYGETGDRSRAVAEMREGLAILDCALGRTNVKYYAAEMAYSQVLDWAGLHSEASQLRAAAAETGKDFSSSQCLQCTIDVAGFR